MSEFGDRLKTLREALGLTQAGLAARLAVSIDNIQNWEQGRTEPRLSAARSLAEALGVSLDVLAGVRLAKKTTRRGRK